MLRIPPFVVVYYHPKMALFVPPVLQNLMNKNALWIRGREFYDSLRGPLDRKVFFFIFKGLRTIGTF